MTVRRAVITGIGLITPAGRVKTEISDNLLAGTSFIKEIDRFDASAYASRHAGLVTGLEADTIFSKRLTKKLDRFSHFALIASDDAIKDAGLDLSTEDKNRIGISFGNAIGGWEFAERELRELHLHGLREVSPYQATAWFPAAPQGQVSIYYGLKGYSKTMISDIASSHLAIDCAARAIMMNRADVMLAGGTEAPISPYALLCCNASGETSTSGNYRPFDRSHDGYVIAEGAAVVIVEEYERARARGARIYAEIAGFGHTSDGLSFDQPDVTGAGLSRAMNMALAAAGVGSGEIDYIMPSGNGGAVYDKAEAAALCSVFGDGLNSTRIGVPKAAFGNLLGASGAVDAAIACLAIESGSASAHTGCMTPDDGAEAFKDSGVSINKSIKNVLINSVGRGGVNTCLVLKVCVQ